MGQKIIFIDQTKIQDPRISDLARDCLSDQWDHWTKRPNFDSGTHSLYVRNGSNNLPFDNSIVNLMSWQIPRYDPHYSVSFSEITDRRCRDLRASRFDRPWVVYYSGGIDSTGIVCSILKNLPKADLDNITIACNPSSIYENPKFFFTHIQPNFRLLSSAEIIDRETSDRYYYFNGEPADQLFAGSIAQSMALRNPEALSKNCVTDPDDLITYIGQKVDPDFGIWYYETVLENLQSSDVPVETYHDFFWWTFFNHSWVSVKFRLMLIAAWDRTGSARPYLENFVNWYDTEDYQRWAMVSNTIGKKYGADVGEYKKTARNYIYQFNKDPYYHRFKTKTSSASHFGPNRDWFCMLDDFTLLNLTDHLAIIKQLLPGHIFPKR